MAAVQHHAAGAGLPADRGACVAAQQAFFDLKRTYLHALQGVRGAEGLRQLVLEAEEPSELWRLRGSAFAALQGIDGDHRGRRQLLHRGLDGMCFELETLADAALS